MERLPELYPREEQLIFHALIGEAIAQWAHVEYGLALLTGACLGSLDASSALFKIENFRSKFGFAEHAFSVSDISQPFRKEGIEALNFAKACSSARNHIAHSRSVCFPGAPPGRQWAIVPLFAQPHDRAQPGQPPSGSLCIKDLDLSRQRFAKASSMLKSLCSRMIGETDLFAEAAQQQLRPRTAAHLRRHYLEDLPKRARSSRA